MRLSQASLLLLDRGAAEAARCAQVRAQVQAIKDRLELGLCALAATASGSPAFTATSIQQLAALVDPLTTSPLVGQTAAYEASLQLCRSLGPELAPHAGDLAAALRLARLSAQPRPMPLALPI